MHLEPQKWMVLFIDHPKVNPRGRQPFKPRNWVVGDSIQNLPFKNGTRVHQSVHVKKAMHEVLTSAKQRGSEDF